MNDAIGGYFGLVDFELGNGGLPINGVYVNTARNALEYILLHLPAVKLVYLPFYTCEAILEPLHKLGIPYKFYHINLQFEIDDDIKLEDGDYIIVNNYFGIKDKYILDISKKFGDYIIIDNAQALYSPILNGIKAIYSIRKFIGVADGGIAAGVSNQYIDKYDVDDSSSHNSHLLLRKEKGAEAGYDDFQKNEEKLSCQPIRSISETTNYSIKHVNFVKANYIRKSNYIILNNALKNHNVLDLPDVDSFKCPMVYPFWPKENCDFRNKLLSNRIYTACYWHNVSKWCTTGDLEVDMSNNIIPLPIDQRYGELEMKIIIDVLYGE